MRQIVILCLLFCLSDRVLAQNTAPPSAEKEPVYLGKTLSAWLKDLQDNDPAGRLRAAKALGRIGPMAKPAVPALLESLKGAERAYFDIAAGALREIDPEIDWCVFEMLNSKDPNSHKVAALAFDETGHARLEVIPTLIQPLKDKDPSVRPWAAYALGIFGPAAHTAVPALIEALNDREKRTWEAWALGRIGPAAHAAVPALIDALNDPKMRSYAVEALGQIGSKASAAVPALVAVFKSSKGHRRWGPIQALGRIGPEAKPAAPLLIEMLKVKEDMIPGSFSPELTYASEALIGIGPVVAADLIEALKTDDQGIQARASHLLDHFGTAIVTDLLRAIQSDDIRVRTEAGHLLVKVGPEAREAVPALIETLADKNPHIRFRAAEDLSQIGKKAKAAVPALVRALKEPQEPNDPDPQISEEARAMVAEALARMGPAAKEAVPALIENLEDQKLAVPWNVAHALEGIGPDAKAAIPALRKAMKKWAEKGDIEGAHNRVRAAEALWKLEGRTDTIVPVLIEALKDERNPEGPYGNVRAPAAGVLAKLGPAAATAVPDLTKALYDTKWEVRAQAAVALAAIGPQAKSALPAMACVARDTNVAALKDLDAYSFLQVIQALEKLDPQSDVVVPTLIKALRHPFYSVRMRAADALGEMGSRARPAIPELAVALSDKDPQSGAGYYHVRSAAAEALWKINRHADVILPVLIDSMNHYRYDNAAAKLIGQMGPAAKPAIPALIKALDQTSHSVSWYSDSIYQGYVAPLFEALANFGPIAQPAVPALRQRLNDWDPCIRLRAAEALWRIERPSSETLSLFTAALKHASARIRMQAAESLGRMGPAAKEATAALVAALDDEYEEVTVRAASALGQIGPQARDAVPALTKALKHADEEVRQAAAEALGKIEPD